MFARKIYALTRRPPLSSDEALMAADLLVLKHRRENIDAIFTGVDIQRNTSHKDNMWMKCQYGHYCCCPFYSILRREFFVPAGHVGLLKNERDVAARDEGRKVSLVAPE